MSTVQFRMATIHDASQIHHLVNTAFSAQDKRLNWDVDSQIRDTFHFSVKQVLDTINKSDSAIVLAVDETLDNFVGSIEVCKRGDGLAGLGMLAVRPNRQQGGVGATLLRIAEKYSVANWGVTSAWLNAMSSNSELIAWYERKGYKKTGKTQRCS